LLDYSFQKTLLGIRLYFQKIVLVEEHPSIQPFGPFHELMHDNPAAKIY